jgi:hypothetical protein
MKTAITLMMVLTSMAGVVTAQNGNLSKVFVLGQEEQRYEQLTSAYNYTLLEASSNDIQAAFAKWLDMTQAMDAYAEKTKFDLKGVKVWMHVFWNEDGRIDHLGYLVRPDSRLVSDDELKAFFASFTGQYQLPMKSSRKFSHYTGANFPTLSERMGGK